LTYELLTSGFDVLISDLDAIWLKSPFPEIENHAADSSLIASRAKFPEDVAERIGATICMGFIYIKSDQNSINLWKQLSEIVSRSKSADDQVSINHLVLRSNIQLKDRLKFYKSNHAEQGTILIDRKPINITFLAQNQFRRHCDIRSPQVVRESVVAHCSTWQKSDSMKKTAVSTYGMWILRDDWKERRIQPDQTVAAFLASLVAASNSTAPTR
jgi:hypothetical protein